MMDGKVQSGDLVLKISMAVIDLSDDDLQVCLNYARWLRLRHWFGRVAKSLFLVN